MNNASVIVGQGIYLPEKCMSNDDIAKIVDTSDEWIRSRSGITQRYIAEEGEYTSDLAAKAAMNALHDAGLQADDIDALIVATSTPDASLPSTATFVQKKNGMKAGFAFDIAAACSGFVYGLSMADAMLKAGQAKRVMVIGAETMSRVVDWNDRSTCVLFGDGAGAWIVEAQSSENAAGKADQRGILHTKLYSDGSLTDILRTDGGVSSTKTAGVLQMQGKDVFRHAVSNMVSAAKEALEISGISPQEVDWVIPHQANIRILDSVMQKLGLAENTLIATLDKHANTSAASVPLATHQAIADGKVKRGDLLALPVLGAGLTWGCALVRW